MCNSKCSIWNTQTKTVGNNQNDACVILNCASHIYNKFNGKPSITYELIAIMIVIQYLFNIINFYKRIILFTFL